jgi:hypothetical protein
MGEHRGESRSGRRRILGLLAGLGVVAVVVITVVVTRATTGSSSACDDKAGLERKVDDARVAYQTPATRVIPSYTVDFGTNGILHVPGTVQDLGTTGSLQEFEEAFKVLAIYAEQNPSCFNATDRAQLEEGYRRLTGG